MAGFGRCLTRRTCGTALADWLTVAEALFVREPVPGADVAPVDEALPQPAIATAEAHKSAGKDFTK
jgi:hypothetical protein